MGHDVFVSHSAKDKPTADAVCATLEAQGIRCWVAPRDIVPGQDWGESIVGAIKGARVMVLIFSTHANVSPQIKREVERAVNKGIPVIPLRIEAIEPTASLEYFLSTPHWLDAFTPPLENHLQYLAQVIRSIMEGTTVKPAPVASEVGTARITKTETESGTTQFISPIPPLAVEKKKFPLLATAVVALILACFVGWYFGVYQPGQKHQADLARIQAEKNAQAAADKQAAEAKATSDAEAARLAEQQAADAKAAQELAALQAADAKAKADALAAQKASEELAVRQAAEAKAEADAEAARKADALAAQKAAQETADKQAVQAKAVADAEAAAKADVLAAQQAVAAKAAEELAAKQAVAAKAQAEATAAQQAAAAATSNQTVVVSSSPVDLSKLTLADFNEIFGLKNGATTNEVSTLFGTPASEYTMGGNFHDQYLIWTYPAGGTEDLKIEFDNETKVVRQITFTEDHLPWLAARNVGDPKLSLFGKSDAEIEKLFGTPAGIYSSTYWYKANGLEVEFLCAEYNYFKCSRIVVSWNGQ